jgi:hypothetical protein
MLLRGSPSKKFGERKLTWQRLRYEDTTVALSWFNGSREHTTATEKALLTATADHTYKPKAHIIFIKNENMEQFDGRMHQLLGRDTCIPNWFLLPPLNGSVNIINGVLKNFLKAPGPRIEAFRTISFEERITAIAAIEAIWESNEDYVRLSDAKIDTQEDLVLLGRLSWYTPNLEASDWETYLMTPEGILEFP